MRSRPLLRVASLLPALLLGACDAPRPAGPDRDAAQGEGWVDGGGLLVPALGAVLSVSGADPEGRRVSTVTLGEGLDCARQAEHDAAVQQAQDRFSQDGDSPALQASLADADLALRPLETWALDLDLGRRADPTEPLRPSEVQLQGERRAEPEPDVAFLADTPEVLSFEGEEGRVAARLRFGAWWSGEGVQEAWYEFVVGFDARACP